MSAVSPNEFVQPVNTDLTNEISLQPDTIEAVDQNQEIGRLQKAMNIGKRATLAFALHLEINPFTNGPIRYGAYLATLKATGNIPASTAVLVGLTGVVEGSGAYAMGGVLERDTSKTLKAFDKLLDTGFDKLHIPRNTKVTPEVEALITNYLGTPALMYAKKRENPQISTHENRKHATVALAALMGACAIQGMTAGEAINDPTNPKAYLPMAIVLGAYAAAKRWMKRKVKKGDKSQDE